MRDAILDMPPNLLAPDFVQADEFTSMGFTNLDFGPLGIAPKVFSDTPLGLPLPDFGTDMFPPETDFSTDLSDAHELPAYELLLQLIELFFEKLHSLLPCFHKVDFLSRVYDNSLQTEAPLLLLAICCVVARYHADHSIRAREKDWYEQARSMYELTRRRPYPGLRTLQAAIILIFHANTVGDFSSSWLFLGKAWRQAVVLGMNHVDGDNVVMMGLNRADAGAGNPKVYGLEKTEAHTAVEKEEFRRTLWFLLITDRIHAWPTGWPHAITETQFKVDFPIADSLFQAMDSTSTSSPYNNASFTRPTRRPGRLMDSLPSAKDPLNVFHYIAVAHVLLGRICELIHSL